MNQVTFTTINFVITNSIRGVAQILKSIIFLLTSVDNKQSKSFEHFTQYLLRLIINIFWSFNYPAKKLCRLSIDKEFENLVLPIS